MKAPERQEVATTGNGRDITQPYLHSLRLAPPTDSILQANGGHYGIYEDVFRDDQVKACFQQRQLAAVSKPWMVKAGDERRISRKAAEFLQKTLEKLPWDDITSKMLTGVYYGYAVAECLWGQEGGMVTLDAIKVRKQRRFGFSGDGSLLLLTAANPMGEPVPERKFWHFSAGADHHDDPYGLGLAHWLYWPVRIKRGGFNMWTTFLNKFGIPTAVGKYPVGISDDERRKLLAALGVIQSESGVVLPDTMTVELLEASRGGSPGYDSIIQICNAAIAKVVLSQTMTTEDGSSQSQATVHMDVRNDLVEADADLICDSFSQSVARWLTEWNFPGAATPVVWRETEDSEDLNRVADRVETLHRAGWEPAEAKEIEHLFGGRWQRVGAGGGEKKGDFSEASQPADPVDVITDKAVGLMAPLLSRMTEQLQHQVEQAESWEDLRGRLLANYPDMDATDLTFMLGQAVTLAELTGRWDVERGR